MVSTANNYQVEEVIKKSSLAAEDSFDYQKITANVQGLIPCSFKESLEDVTFLYDLTDLKPLREIKGETQEKQRQFLVNFVKLYNIFMQYCIEISEDNIFYDENMIPSVKARDLYGREKRPDEKEFLHAYKCVAGGLLSRKYQINQVLESGLEILHREKNLNRIVQADHIQELVEILKNIRDNFLKNKQEKIKEVSKKKYSFWKITAIAMFITGITTGALSIYYGGFIIPREKALVTANERFIIRDYVGCIDSIKQIEIEEMDIHTKYILATAYASTESFKQEEISNIVSRLSINSNEKELEYWIRLGRLEVKEAENLALALSDDKLLIYAYMKEIDILENESNIDGEEKKSRLDTLNSEIKALGEKYKAEE